MEDTATVTSADPPGETTIPTLEPKHLEEQEDEDNYEFPEDVYTMMFFSNPWSWSYCYGLFVFFFQQLILGLVLVDILDDTAGKREGTPSEKNFFNVPFHVDTVVTIAQGVAILLAVVSRDDVTNTLDLVTVGYSNRCQEIFPHATYSSFLRTNAFRLFMGLSVVFVSFVFIVQADSVLDIFLNFAAIEFVAGLDDLAYTLAKEGWIGSPIKRSIKEMEDEKIQLPECKTFFLRHYARPLLVSMLLGCLYAVWVYLYLLQVKGTFLNRAFCGTVA
jgi:hypothetical protein